MKKFVLLVLMLFTCLTTVKTIKAEPYITEDWTRNIGCGVATDFYYCQSGTPSIIDKYTSYYVYIPTDLVDELSSIKMTFYNGYTSMGYHTLLTSNTNNPNVFKFLSTNAYQWDLYGNNITLEIWGETGTSMTNGEAEALEDDILILYSTALNVSRLNVVDYEAIYDTGYDNGHDDGYEVGYEDGYEVGDEEGYEVGYEDGYDVGILETFEDTMQIEPIIKTAFNGLGDLLNINLLPNITIGMIVAVPLVLGLLAFVIGVSTGKGKK